MKTWQNLFNFDKNKILCILSFSVEQNFDTRKSVDIFDKIFNIFKIK